MTSSPSSSFILSWVYSPCSSSPPSSISPYVVLSPLRPNPEGTSSRFLTMGFLRWGDLPLHQLKRKRGTIVDDEDITEEMKTQMVEKTKSGFLKAQDVVEIVASQEIQSIFTLKGISKPSIPSKQLFVGWRNWGGRTGSLKMVCI